MVRPADAFPFDASLDIAAQRGLSRLRCLENRDYADALYRIYRQNEERWRRQEQAEADAPFEFPDEFSADIEEHAPETGTAARAAWDAKNSAISHAWKEWEHRWAIWAAEIEAEKGSAPSRDCKSRNRDAFARLLRRKYGQAYPVAQWVEEHDRWHGR